MGVNVLNGGAVEGLALRRCLNPSFQRGLFLFFPADDVEVPEGQFLPLPLLPAVGAAGVLVGILQLHGRVGAHGFPHEVLAHGAGVDADTVGGNHLLQLGGGLVALGAARVAHNHGVVVLLNTLGGNLQAPGGLVRHILRAVGGGHVVRSGIHAEHGEVAGVAGPHPVVGLSAELTHGCRGRPHKTHIRIGAVNGKVVEVVVVETLHFGAAAGVGGGSIGLQLFDDPVLFLRFFHYAGNIFNGHQEGDA